MSINPGTKLHLREDGDGDDDNDGDEEDSHDEGGDDVDDDDENEEEEEEEEEEEGSDDGGGLEAGAASSTCPWSHLDLLRPLSLAVLIPVLVVKDALPLSQVDKTIQDSSFAGFVDVDDDDDDVPDNVVLIVVVVVSLTSNLVAWVGRTTNPCRN